MKEIVLKDMQSSEHITQPQTTSLHLGSLQRNSANNKSDLFCCFMDFIKSFDTVPRNNMWNRLEKLKVPFELRDSMIWLYEKVISKFKNNEEWKTDLSCNIGVKQVDRYNLSWDSYHPPSL